MTLTHRIKPLMIITTLWLSAIITPAHAQADVIAIQAMTTAMKTSFVSLEQTLTQLFRTETRDVALSTIMGNAYTSLAKTISGTNQANPVSGGLSWNEIQQGIIAGFKNDPATSKAGVFESKGGSSIDTKKLYQAHEKLQAATEFDTFDYPFNPAKGSKGTSQANIAPNSLSFDALLAGDTTSSDQFIATLLSPEDIPNSIQGYILTQYGQNTANSKKFADKTKKDILYPNGELRANLKHYQAKRRKFLALQSIIISNLQAIKQMGASNVSTKQTLNDLVAQNDNISKASAITIARLNLMTNIIIADELSKRREIDQRMLSTMTVALLSDLDQTKQSMLISQDDSDWKSITAWLDKQFLDKDEQTADLPTVADPDQ